MRQAVAKIRLREYFPKTSYPPQFVNRNYMAKQVLDIHPGIGMTVSQSNEHLRVASNGAYVSRLSNNFDPTREHLNFEVLGGRVLPVDKELSIPKRIEWILWKRGIKDPNKELVKRGKEPNRRTVANIILGGSREQMRSLAFGNQEVNFEHGADNSSVVRMPEIENWAKDMYRFMGEKFGEQNIAAFVVHLDETNPHIHCTLLPITERKKFSWNMYFGGFKEDGRQKFISLHNAIAEINAKYGLERGEKIAETGAKHRTTEQYHRDLRKQLKEENQKLVKTNMELDDTIEAKNKTIAEKEKTIQSLNKEIKHASATVKSLNTMILHLETYKENLEKEIEQLVHDRDSGKISAEEAAKKMELVNKRLEDVKANILDKEDKLKTAEAKLQNLVAQTDKLEQKADETENRYHDVQKKLDVALPEYNKKVLQEMQALGYNIAAIDAMDRYSKYADYKNNLSTEERSFLDKSDSVLLDGSMFEQLADNAANITTVATALYLGYLDKATSIAESNGGGGGPGTGWGKKDDEDDLAFKRRCMFMAMHMMQPQRKLGRKR